MSRTWPSGCCALVVAAAHCCRLLACLPPSHSPMAYNAGDPAWFNRLGGQLEAPQCLATVADAQAAIAQPLVHCTRAILWLLCKLLLWDMIGPRGSAYSSNHKAGLTAAEACAAVCMGVSTMRKQPRWAAGRGKATLQPEPWWHGCQGVFASSGAVVAW
jgi:hypothetical protein